MIPESGGGSAAADAARDDEYPMISQREIWTKQETVVTKRVMRYVSIDGWGNSTNLVETDRRLEEVVHVKIKGDTGGSQALEGVNLTVRVNPPNKRASERNCNVNAYLNRYS